MSHPTRASESRVATQRDAIGVAVSTRGIDLANIPEGYEPVWVRETILQQYDSRNVGDALKKGYVPAEYAKHAAAQRPLQLPGREPPKDDLIRDGSDVLMLRSADQAQREQDEARALSAAHINSVQRVGNDPGSSLDNEYIVESSQVLDSKSPRGRPKPRFPE